LRSMRLAHCGGRWRGSERAPPCSRPYAPLRTPPSPASLTPTPPSNPAPRPLARGFSKSTNSRRPTCCAAATASPCGWRSFWRTQTPTAARGERQGCAPRAAPACSQPPGPRRSRAAHRPPPGDKQYGRAARGAAPPQQPWLTRRRPASRRLPCFHCHKQLGQPAAVLHGARRPYAAARGGRVPPVWPRGGG
jgi:hypothetical protein